MDSKTPCTIDAATGEVEDSPTPVGTRYRAKLDTATDCRKEMAKCYKEARSGIIDVAEASKFVWMLSSIATVIKTSDIELRLDALESSR